MTLQQKEEGYIWSKQSLKRLGKQGLIRAEGEWVCVDVCGWEEPPLIERVLLNKRLIK